MKHRSPSTRLHSFLLLLLLAFWQMGTSTTQATPYYWDPNGTTAGFGTVVGAWNGTNAFWGPNAIGTGGTYIAAPTTSDDLFITGPYTTNAGAITQTGTQNAGSVTFGTTDGAISITGGTLNLGAAATINANNWNIVGGNTISSIISGAATSLTKNGTGGLILQGANTYTGATIINGYTPGLASIVINGATGSISTSSGITFNGSALTLTNATAQGAVDRLNSSAASLITSNGGILAYNNANTAGNTYAEVAGTLTLASGQFNVSLGTDVTSVVTSTQTLTFGGLTQAGTSSVTFSAAGTGLQVAGNKNMIVVTGGGTTAGNAIIGPWATVGTTTLLQTDYAKYTADYVVGANIGGTGQASWTVTGEAFTQSSASETLGGNRTMTALRNTGTTAATALAGNFLETFGLLNGVTTAWTISDAGSGGVRQQGTSAANLYVNAGSGVINISAKVTNNTGALTLVKTGANALNLTNSANDYSGGTIVNGGVLNFTTGALGTTGSITINTVSGFGTNQANVARLQWGTSTNTDLSSRLNMVNNGYAMLDTNGNNVSFANGIGSSSSSSLGKTGTGTLTFNAANNYTGSTDVWNGTLVVNAALSSTSVRAGGSTAIGGAAGAILRLGGSNLLSSSVAVIVDGQSVNTFDLQTFNQTIGALSLGSNNGGVSGTVTGSGSSTLTLTAGVTVDGHNNGAGTVSVPFLDLNGATQIFSIVNSSNATSNLTISSVIQNGGITKTGSSLLGFLILSGANTFSGPMINGNGMLRLDNAFALQNSPLDTANSVTGDANNGIRTTVTNLTLGGFTGNKNFAALFTTNGTNPGQYNTVTALTLNPGAGKSYTYDAIIGNGAAAMQLNKTGAGTQILNNAVHTYSGATNITAGKLRIDGIGSINSSSGVTINGATANLGYNSSVNLSAPLTFTQGTLSGTNWNGSRLSGLTIGTNQTISPGNSPGTATTVTQIWAGGGTYQWEINDALGTKGATPPVTGWDWLNVTDTSTGALAITATSGSKFTIDITGLNTSNVAGAVSNWNPFTSGQSWIIASASGVGGTVTGFVDDKFNLQTTNFTNNNPISNGGFTISQSGQDVVLGFTAATTAYWDTNGSTAGAGTTPNGNWSTSDAKWSADSTGSSSTYNWVNGNNAVFSAGTDATGTYTATISGGVSAHNVTLEEGDLTIAASTLTLTGTTPTITVGTGRTLEISSEVAGTVGVTTAGSGTLVFSGANSYSGGTVIGTGSILQIGNGGGAGVLGSGDVSGSGTLQFNRNNAYSVSNNITGNVSVAQIGSDILTLSGTNTYSGKTTISGGTLSVSSAGNLGTVPGATVADQISISNGATLQATDNISLSTNQGVTIGTGGGTMEVASTKALTVNGAITGGANTFNKTGAGELILINASNTAGTTNVSAGKLSLNTGSALTSTTTSVTGSGSALVVNGTLAGDLTTASGTVLRGTGEITGSANIAGSIEAGEGSVIASLKTGALTLNSLGATFDYKIDRPGTPAGDLIAVSGALNLNSNSLLTITDLGSGSWLNGDKLTLISYTAGAWDGGLFNYGGTLANGSTFSLSGVNWQFNYNDAFAGTNFTGDPTGLNFVTMTVQAAPEPSRAVLMLIGAAGLLMKRRRI